MVIVHPAQGWLPCAHVEAVLAGHRRCELRRDQRLTARCAPAAHRDRSPGAGRSRRSKQEARQLSWRAFNVANWPGAEAGALGTPACDALASWTLTALAQGPYRAESPTPGSS